MWSVYELDAKVTFEYWTYLQMTTGLELNRQWCTTSGFTRGRVPISIAVNCIPILRQRIPDMTSNYLSCSELYLEHSLIFFIISYIALWIFFFNENVLCYTTWLSMFYVLNTGHVFGRYYFAIIFDMWIHF